MITITDKRQVGESEFFTVMIDGTKIPDCSVKNGAKGEFISGLAKSYKAKDGTTKWTYVTFSNEHQHEIKAILKGAALPEVDVNKIGFDDDSIPF